jgi:cell division protein FtsN
MKTGLFDKFSYNFIEGKAPLIAIVILITSISFTLGFFAGKSLSKPHEEGRTAVALQTAAPVDETAAHEKLKRLIGGETGSLPSGVGTGVGTGVGSGGNAGVGNAGVVEIQPERAPERAPDAGKSAPEKSGSSKSETGSTGPVMKETVIKAAPPVKEAAPKEAASKAEGPVKKETPAKPDMPDKTAADKIVPDKTTMDKTAADKSTKAAQKDAAADTASDAKKTDTGAERYFIQAGAFKSASEADKLAGKLKAMGFKPEILKGTKLVRVKLGDYNSRDEAYKILLKLDKKGVKGFVRRY